MNAKRLVLWVVLLAVSALAVGRWQRVEAWAPQTVIVGTADETPEAVRGEVRNHVLAYEAKLHGWRPMGEDAQIKESRTPEEPSPILSTSDRLRDEQLGGAQANDTARPLLSTPDEPLEESAGQREPVRNDGRGRPEPTEW